MLKEKSIFTRIMDGEIPSEMLYADDRCVVIKDINPQAPVHLLLIPKKEIPNAQEVAESDLNLMGHLMTKIPSIAKEAGVDADGYRLIINCKSNGGQEVPHLHIHLLGGRKMKWPPG